MIQDFSVVSSTFLNTFTTHTFPVPLVREVFEVFEFSVGICITCHCEAFVTRRPCPTRGCCAVEKKNMNTRWLKIESLIFLMRL
jgi:hypothetical protein